MVVVPTDEHVELTYGRQPVEWIGYALTLLGIGLAIFLATRPPVRGPARPAPATGDEPTAADGRLGARRRPSRAGGLDRRSALRRHRDRSPPPAGPRGARAHRGRRGAPRRAAPGRSAGSSSLADLTAIAVASVFSYFLHRTLHLPLGSVRPLGADAGRVLRGRHGRRARRRRRAAQRVRRARVRHHARPDRGQGASRCSPPRVVRLVLYRAVLLQSVRQRLHERVARPPAPGRRAGHRRRPRPRRGPPGIGATIAAIRDALADGRRRRRPRGRGRRRRLHRRHRRRRARRRAPTRWWCSRRTGARAPPSGPGWPPPAGAPSPSPTPTSRTRPTSCSGCSPGSRTGGTSPSATVATRTRRACQGAGALRDLGSRAVNLLAMAVLLSHPHDTQCGLKAFRSDVAKPVFALGRVDRFAFDIEVLHLVERHGWTVVEVPVQRHDGRAHHRPAACATRCACSATCGASATGPPPAPTSSRPTPRCPPPPDTGP